MFWVVDRSHDLQGDWCPWDPEEARSRVFQSLPEDPTSIRMYLGNSPNNLRLVEVWEQRHYCALCEETMLTAWGDDCPICHTPMERVLVCLRT